MQKQKKQFIILCVILVAFCGIFFGLRAFNKHQDEKKAKEEEAEKITAVSLSVDDVTEFSYQYNGAEIAFVKEDDTWYSKDDRERKITQSAISSMLSSAGTVTASQKLEAPENISEYGFDTPLNVIRLKTGDQETTITIGMYNSITSQYYLMVSGDENVYLVENSIYTAFQKSLEDVTEEEETPDSESGE